MRIIPVIFCLILLSNLAFAESVKAETRYVSDELIITLRQGQGTKYKILKTLKTGTPVEVLEEGEEYLKVRIGDGQEGYVLRQYISSETPKSVIISRLQKERDRLRDELASARKAKTDLATEVESGRKSHATDIDRLENEAETLRKNLLQTENELQSTREQYEDLKERAANVVELTSERDQLQARSDQLATEVETLRNENERMLYTGMIKWFLAGSGVFLTGWIIGKTSRKKRRGGFS